MCRPGSKCATRLHLALTSLSTAVVCAPSSRGRSGAVARAGLLAILAMAAPVMSGCGTCFNYMGAEKAGPTERQEFGRIYGGTLFECMAVQSLFREDKSQADDPEPSGVFTKLCVAGLLAVDLP